MENSQLQERYIEISDKLVDVECENKTLRDLNAHQETRIKELEQYNQKLFLRATSSQATEEQPIQQPIQKDFNDLY